MIERARALLVVVLLIPAALAIAQPARDAKALLGFWAGAWKSSSGSGGYLSISVDAVDRDQVRGVLFMTVSTPDAQGYYNRDVRFFGAFDGTMLRITVPPALTLSMTLNGGSLRGDVQGQQTFGTVSLDKQR